VYQGKKGKREMAGGSENGGHDQRAMEEGKEEYPAADQGCAMASVPFLQKVRGHVQDILLNSSLGFLLLFFVHRRLTTYFISVFLFLSLFDL
jgi:hypothetical protein